MLLRIPDLQYVSALIRRLAGVVLDQSREALVGARLGTVAEKEGFKSVGELLGRLQATPVGDLHHRVVEAFLNNETWFFRHLDAFDAMRRFVIPDLASRRAGDRRLRIWSAGCASGQEAYSAAILLQEHFPTLAGWDVRILATDFSTAMLKRARDGIYSQIEVNRGLPAPLLMRYFEKRHLQWRIRDEARRPIDFERVNLVEELPPLPAMDIVLLRNVMIYFDVETKKEVLRRVRQVLRPDGYLFLGAAETTLMLDDAFRSSTLDRVICYRLNGQPGK